MKPISLNHDKEQIQGFSFANEHQRCLAGDSSGLLAAG